ncbi:MAG: hypothetical protein MI748_01495 [Opitutales bacterium]|nr:hypothetical protein [Opitutales bacterium]
MPDLNLSGGIVKERNSVSTALLAHHESSFESISDNIDSTTWFDLKLSYKYTTGRLHFQHSLLLSNLTDEEFYVAEYVRRRTVTALPTGVPRSLLYRLTISF